jgi:hypothetical protein
MYNFVAIADENPWLDNLDVDEVNRALQFRRHAFMRFINSQDGKDYFDESKFGLEQKERVSPEVYQIKWVPLDEAVETCLTSVLAGVFVNEWQEREFSLLGRKARDPLIMTGATLIELECFPDVESLQRHCAGVSLESLREKEQWLFEGMLNDDVQRAFRRRLGKQGTNNPSFISLRKVRKERRRNSKRRAHDERAAQAPAKL